MSDWNRDDESWGADKGRERNERRGGRDRDERGGGRRERGGGRGERDFRGGRGERGGDYRERGNRGERRGGERGDRGGDFRERRGGGGDRRDGGGRGFEERGGFRGGKGGGARGRGGDKPWRGGKGGDSRGGGGGGRGGYGGGGGRGGRDRGGERSWGRAQGPTRPPTTPLPDCDASQWQEPWVQLKYFRFAPTIFSSMVAAASAEARAGDLVQVRDPEGGAFGWGFWNPNGRVSLRIIAFGEEPIDVDALLKERIIQAIALRKGLPELSEAGEAWRVINSDGDELSGLTVDCYGETLIVEVHSLAIWQRLPMLLETLHAELGTRAHQLRVDEKIASIEGIQVRDHVSTAESKVKVSEWGITYEVDFSRGHKTGFFCDQRNNRRQFGQWIQKLKPEAKVLDLCSYTGGFSLSAKLLGGASEVTAVDLDEEAIDMARRNAHINDVHDVKFIHADAFDWARQMIENNAQYDAIVVDPPKFLTSREMQREGERKYQDLNGLAVQLAKPGALLVTCSCSGLLSVDSFREQVCRGVHRAGKSLQILAETGAGLDHPVASRAPEGRYLKVIWAIVR